MNSSPTPTPMFIKDGTTGRRILIDCAMFTHPTDGSVWFVETYITKWDTVEERAFPLSGPTR